MFNTQQQHQYQHHGWGTEHSHLTFNPNDESYPFPNKQLILLANIDNLSENSSLEHFLPKNYQKSATNCQNPNTKIFTLTSANSLNFSNPHPNPSPPQLSTPPPTTQQDNFSTSPQFINVTATPLPPKKLPKKLSSSILKQICVKKVTKKFAISKFLVRLFLKYHQQYEISSETKSYNKLITKQLALFNENKFNLERDTMKFLNPQLNNALTEQTISIENRTIMRCILHHKICNEVIKNYATERNRISYLIGSKIYAIRCRSRLLCRKANFK